MRVEAVYGFAALAFSLACASAAAEERAAFAGANDKVTALVMQASIAPTPFQGSDGFTHMAYELQLINPRSQDVVVESIEVLDAATGEVLLKLAGAPLSRSL